MTRFLPSWKNALLSVLSAVLLILAFPDFEFWFLAWFALVPLLWAVERERGLPSPQESSGLGGPRSFVLGWIFGVVFFFGTCWWLTYAPITYAAFPPLLAYFLLFCITAVAAIFPGIFGLLLSVFLRRFGTWAFLLAPFVWVFSEFLRYWITGNNWNAIGYSQAGTKTTLQFAEYGGVLFAGFFPFLLCSLIALWITKQTRHYVFVIAFFVLLFFSDLNTIGWLNYLNIFRATPFGDGISIPKTDGRIIAVQPNVPMSGLSRSNWDSYRQNHVRLAEFEIRTLDPDNTAPATVIFPESPMNFMYGDDPDTKNFINEFAARNNVSVLFNSAEPNSGENKYFNSAVLVGPEGKMIGQYDKIYLLPFGEAVPTPLQSIVPAFVGSFSYGSEYDLLPIGDAKAGVMICFESHFGQLSREYVRNRADVIIEMTNDGYLGPTPVLRQHLANAVFRAVETNRPVLRVTNVGITAYISERGEVLDAAEPYTEATRVWSVSKSDGSQTFYVKYGDWFAWLCLVITIAMLVFALHRKHSETAEV